MKQARRMAPFKEYPFERGLKRCRELKEAGHFVLNLGVGSPDLNPPPGVGQSLTSALNAPGVHRYQGSRGSLELRAAIADWYQRWFKVDLDAHSDILPLIGSKEGIYLISLAFLNEGNEVLVPNPGYVNYRKSAELVGATAIDYQLDEAGYWLPDLAKLRDMDTSNVKLMWINNPHMPTGSTMGQSALLELRAFAREREILLINDCPYALLSSSPYSILSDAHPNESCLELNSLSKAYHMAGWRLGMVCGHANLIDPIFRLQSHFHSGIFLPLQRAAVTALNSDPAWRMEQNNELMERREAVTHLLNQLGFHIPESTTQEGLFAWAKAPDHIENLEAHLDELLLNTHIFLAPGSFFGSAGERWVRASLCVPVEEIRAFQRTMTV